MKVIISVPGIWAAFYQAAELDRHGHLGRIITSYPRFILKRRGERVDYSKVVTIPVAELVARTLVKMPSASLRYSADCWKTWIFDGLVRRMLSNRRDSFYDLFIGFSGFCLESIRAVKAAGAVNLVLRNSTHMLYQQKILRDEYTHYGLSHAKTHPYIIEKELAEYKEADYIRVPSEFARQTFIEQGIDREKVLMIPHGVDLRDFKPATKQDEIFRVIYVSALILRKGVQYLLEAFSQLRLKQSELVLIGGISDEVKPILEKHQGQFRYAGKIPHRELWRHYSQGSVYVLPTIEEGFAVTILEAMACGLPVIVSENSGARGVVRDGIEGYITPIRDIDALKEKLLYLYEHEHERQIMANNALQRAQEFGLEQYGEQLIKECEWLISRNAHR